MHLSLLSAGLGSAAAASAEARLQAVDEVADDGEDKQEDDDNDRDDDVAGHFGGGGGERLFGWSDWLVPNASELGITFFCCMGRGV